MKIAFCLLLTVFLNPFLWAIDSEKDTFEITFKEAESCYNKGKELSLAGQYPEANEEYKKAEQLLDKIKDLPVPQDATGAILNDTVLAGPFSENKTVDPRQTNIREAIKIYLRMLETQPVNTDIRYNLAVLYLKVSEYWRAAQELSQVLEINPKDKDAHYNLGVLYEIYLDDALSAAHHYKKYLELNPSASDKSLVEGWIQALYKKTK